MSRDNLETTRDESASRLGTGIIYVEGRGKKKWGVGGQGYFRLARRGGGGWGAKRFYKEV